MTIVCTAEYVAGLLVALDAAAQERDEWKAKYATASQLLADSLPHIATTTITVSGKPRDQLITEIMGLTGLKDEITV